MKNLTIILFILTLNIPPLKAGNAKVVSAHFTKSGGSWQIRVTLKHSDTGWKHYADAWRVVTAKGRVLATRTLYHPHVDEQPFARSLNNVKIPSHITIVFVEAHDKVHGWNPERLRVDLNKRKGSGFRVDR